MTTAMAFTYFRERVKFAILEVGMGGRLDATNVVRQDVSVITSIGFDHQQFSATRWSRSPQRKPGSSNPPSLWSSGPEAEFDAIREHAGKRLYVTRHLPREARPLGGGYFDFDVTTPIRQYRNLRPALPGRHQLDNVVVAIRAAECLKLSREQIELGVNSAVWPGRLERIPGSSVVPSGRRPQRHGDVCALCATLEEFYPEGCRR